MNSRFQHCPKMLSSLAFAFHIVWVLAPYTEVWLEEKLTNIESENKVLCQQAVSMAPNKILSGRSRSILQSLRGTPQVVNLSFVNGGLTGGAEALHQVEAKYPALLFKQQLIAFVEKIYRMI
ncbi:Myosin-9 [Camellia lanceoleosa]|uniref:Myosin-9 n=1 Tax=Camellia lanceoleosa TaxID=1840588 RepID=A0ACC0IIZ1_9ERIC|nr:Myosin-9 [Camellia lanceoleosa]